MRGLSEARPVVFHLYVWAFVLNVASNEEEKTCAGVFSLTESHVI